MLKPDTTEASKHFLSLSNLFDRNVIVWKVRFPIRLLIPLFAVIIVKFAAAILIFYTLDISGNGTFWSNPAKLFDWPQNQVLLANVNDSTKWPLTFVGWDSTWYVSIMTKGYAFSPQSYTFSPALPFTGYLLNLVLDNPVTSIVVVSFVSGVLLVPLYQLLAENYLSKKMALLSALIFAFSPYIFLFSSVAYSESLMLFFILGAWVLANRGKMFGASVFAALAPLARTMGVLAVVPMLYNSLKTKERRARNILLSFLPLISLASWFAYLSQVTGTALAPVSTTEWSQLWTVRTLILNGIPRYGLKAVMEAPYQIPPIGTHWLLPASALISIVVPCFILATSWRKSKLLWLYGALGFSGVLWYGAVVSIPRFMSAIFPFWILLFANVKLCKKVVAVAVLCIGVSLLLSLDLWFSFLSGIFVA